jgi:hypothetical protein
LPLEYVGDPLEKLLGFFIAPLIMRSTLAS